MLRALPMLRHTRELALILCSTVFLGCPTSHDRCRRGTLVPGSSPPQCVLDGGSDAGDVPVTGDVSDVPPVMCGADGGPSAAPDPLADVLDQNCDGVDGVASDTVFVSESGMDMPSAGLTPDAPVRSLPFALARAGERGRSVILMRVGVYDTVHGAGGADGTRVEIGRSVTIVGRYTGNQWIVRDGTAPSVDTEVRGPTAGVLVRAGRVTLIGLNVLGALAAATEGKSTYGVLAVDAPDLTLRDLVIRAGDGAPGTPGLAARAGADGRRGEDALSNGTGGRGGVSCASTTNAGGEGGNAGLAGGTAPTEGQPGEAPPGRAPSTGGPAGENFDTRGRDGAAGVDGTPGAVGRNGLLGYFSSAGFTPDRGLRGAVGEPGTGGGGGGGAFTTMTVTGGGGGGGGGGGCGGEPGTGGLGGGGSFGVYLYGTTTANLMNCAISAGQGGAGGAGGVGGGVPGDGGVPEASRGGLGGAGAFGRSTTSDAGVTENRGGAGGAGGRGGVGGGGGPGLGGPSIGVVRVAGARADIDAMTRSRINIGAVGTNGAGPITMPQTQYRSTEEVLAESAPDAGSPVDAAMTDASAD